MKKSFIIALLFSLFLGNTSKAGQYPSYELEEVSSDKILVMGQAIESKTTGEQIALACVGTESTAESCKKMRFVWMNRSSAFLFGPNIEIKNESELKGELKATYKKLKKQLKKERRNETADFFTTFLSMGAVATGVMTVFVLVPVLREAAFLSLFVLLPGTSKLIDITHFDPFGATMGSIDVRGINATKTAEGWNWSVETKKLPHQKFYNYKRAIEAMAGDYTRFKIKMNPARTGQCRVGSSGMRFIGNAGYNNSLFDQYSAFSAQRADFLNEIGLMNEMAKSLGCVLAPEEKNPEYKLRIMSEKTKKHGTTRYEIINLQNEVVDSREISYREAKRAFKVDRLRANAN